MSAASPATTPDVRIPDEAVGLVVYAAGDVRVEPVPVRAPRPDEAVVEVAYGGICGSDLHYWQHGAAGLSILKEPMLLGHEIVGIVRHGAGDGSGPPPGTPVAVHPATPGPGDGTQRYPADRPNLSPGCTYLGSAAHRPHTQGGFARHLTIAARMLRPLPAGLTLRTAAVAEPAGVAWHAVGRAGDVRGRRTLVIGAGPIGALVVAVLRRAGAAEITVVDLHQAPLDRARALGATRTLLASDVAALRAVQPDVTVESSGSVRGLAAAITSTARGGRVVMLGLLPPGDQPVPIATAIERELELVGSFRFNDEIDDVLQALADRSLDVDAVVTHEYSIDDAHTALTTAADPVRSGKVLLRFTDPDRRKPARNP
jgi:threonine dehydrogenase-like Zn-dependent dehydrogenase